MVSAATALSTVEYGRSWLGYVAYGASAGVAAGMWLGDHHWMSDIISGALFGVAIGRSVGLAFRDEPPGATAVTWLLAPWSPAGTSGVQLVGSW